jgi:hypothetical protein
MSNNNMHLKLELLFLPLNITESRDVGAQKVKVGHFSTQFTGIN